MKLKPHIRQAFIFIGAGIIFMLLVSFISNRQRNRICEHIEVQIADQYGNYFIDQTDVINLLSQNGAFPIIGKPQKKISLKDLEKRLKTNKFVKSCQISKNLNGDLVIFVEQCRPIARIVSQSGADVYVSETGTILPMSDNFTARVLPVEIKNRRLLERPDSLARTQIEGVSYLDVLKYIDSHKFWKAQIAEMLIEEDGEILLFPQIGKQTIEFGTQENLEKKFEKLDIFYRKIIPEKGWNKYERVNVAYENQIVCQ
jgi:cell division protein FtsQ